MKLYLFLSAKFFQDASQMCFLSFLRYHGYDMEKHYLDHIFQKDENGVTFSHFLKALDYLNVVYDIETKEAFRKKDVSSIIIKQHHTYQLCCGQCFGYLFMMDPIKGYRLIKETDFLKESLDGCVRLKFLGEFNYMSLNKTLWLSLKKDVLFAFLFSLLNLIPFQNAFLKYIIMLLFTLFCLIKYQNHFQSKQNKVYEGFLEIEKQYQDLSIVHFKLHLSLILFLENCIFLISHFQMGIPLILVTLLTTFLSYRITYSFIFLGLGYLCLAKLFLYFHQTISFQFLFGVSLSFILYFLFECMKDNFHQKNIMDITQLERFHFEKVDMPKIESIGFGFYSISKSTLITGNQSAFYRQLRSPSLMVNHLTMSKFGIIDFCKDIIFLENLLHLPLNQTLLEIFEDRVESLLETLEEIDAFEKTLYLKRKVNSLNKQQRELFGFLDLYLNGARFCIIEEAFIYQNEEMFKKCMWLVSCKNEKCFIFSTIHLSFNAFLKENLAIDIIDM